MSGTLRKAVMNRSPITQQVTDKAALTFKMRGATAVLVQRQV
jgi:hypothetical protein